MLRVHSSEYYSENVRRKSMYIAEGKESDLISLNIKDFYVNILKHE